MMTRTQISLPPEALRKAKERAAALGNSLAHYIRHLIVRDLEPRHSCDPSLVFRLKRFRAEAEQLLGRKD